MVVIPPQFAVIAQKNIIPSVQNARGIAQLPTQPEQYQEKCIALDACLHAPWSAKSAERPTTVPLSMTSRTGCAKTAS